MVQIAAYGAGVNSTAMIIGLTQQNVVLDAIVFSDTGSEKPDTYAFLSRFDQWLQQNGQVNITTVRKTSKDGAVMNLEQYCLDQHQLPSMAYGYKQCAQKFKIAPQEKWMNHFPAARPEWKQKNKVVKYIGFDAAETRRVKADDKKYTHRYPLIEWQWDRNRCKQEITNTGLCLPPKSSCFFCPNMRKTEVIALPADLQERAVAMERNAQSTLREIKGLGRNYKWEDLLSADKEQAKLFDDLELYQLPCSCMD